MQTIKESLQTNSDVVLESVIDKHMQMLINQLMKFRTKPKEVFDKLRINADKVDPSRLRVYKVVDSDTIKAVEKAMKDRNKYIFGIKDEMICVIYNTTLIDSREDNYIWLPTKEGHVFREWETRVQNPLWVYKESSKNISRQAKMFEHCDEIWILDYSTSLQRTDVQRKRRDLKDGRWENTPEFYAKVLQDNLERYKTKSAMLRMQKGSEFESVMKDVNKFINNVSELLIDMHKNMDPDQWGYQYKCKELMMDTNICATRIFDNIRYVLKAQHDYEYAKNRGGYSEDFYIAQYNENLQDLKKFLKEGKEKYDLLIKTIEDFKKGENIDIF